MDISLLKRGDILIGAKNAHTELSKLYIQENQEYVIEQVKSKYCFVDYRGPAVIFKIDGTSYWFKESTLQK